MVKLQIGIEKVEGKEWFVFEVSDIGVGLTEEQCKKVFGELKYQERF